MILRDDPHRVFHTDGGNLIVTGSKDRKLRFIEMENRTELDLKISGHAGSIKCVYLNGEEKYVLTKVRIRIKRMASSAHEFNH
jgi:F-box/WD-40 domain protein 10